ncbi:glycosyltransferase [Candidatus Magnetominusculus xianensis]|uniref:Glycosyltransferase n=1 Tax=Candidatus Magnetominusculus xianensis TaxID=1748249 RepID=A0ABR5SHG6_9BACT|nr:glycosyltransferase [Candidatus Magnetominusculus xianensis]KWT91552.1 glycosyltransferase [Candidatus Magnetominusculus xianensis]MBF0404338.1 glycosyltransferase [Nitrospirota bacterium]
MINYKEKLWKLLKSSIKRTFLAANTEIMHILFPVKTSYSRVTLSSVDEHPWKHPFLTETNIKRMRQYSEQVWEFALDYQKHHSKPLKCAFVLNIAQNMYKWARLAQKYGAETALFLDIWDKTAICAPEWEEFDGEYQNILDGETFLKNNPNIKAEVPVYPMYYTQKDGGDLIAAYKQFYKGNHKPLYLLQRESLSLRHEILLSYNDVYPYYQLAKALTEYDVVYAAGPPIASYASGRPYIACPFGGDFVWYCGRGDDYGRIAGLSFNAAKFITFSLNAQNMGHARRLGLVNGLFLPYPMDSERYSPGQGHARKIWEDEYGKGIYVLMTARLDRQFKGQDESFVKAIFDTAKNNASLRFVFLKWGTNADNFMNQVNMLGMSKQFIFLPTVGKRRLIDYYRSCDIVIDQLVWGYHGATALESASIGKPIVTFLRLEHYKPATNNDVMPVINVTSPSEIKQALLDLAANDNYRLQKGAETRDWLVRNHGENKTIPLLLAILKITADLVSLPKDISQLNPLLDPIQEEEKKYHESCLQKVLQKV